MSQLSTRRQYAAGQSLLKNDLDAFIDDIETFINVIGLNDDNIQDDGITASTKILDGSLNAEKIANLAITTAKITDANVTTAKIADLAVTTAKILDANVTTAKIADSNVTTAKINNLAVTGDKLEASLKTVTSDTLSASIIRDASFTTVKSTNFTSTGYPVLLLYFGDFGFQWNGTGIRTDQSAQNFADILITRAPAASPSSETAIMTLSVVFEAGSGNPAVHAVSEQMRMPGATIKHLDTPAAGSYIYRIKGRLLCYQLESGALRPYDPSFDTRHVFQAGSGLFIKELV